MPPAGWRNQNNGNAKGAGKMAGEQAVYISIASAINATLWSGIIALCAYGCDLDLHSGWLAVLSLLSFSATALCLQALGGRASECMRESRPALAACAG
jgi:hypothetical protein